MMGSDCRFFSYSVIKVDSFTRMLWNIYTKVRSEGLAQVFIFSIQGLVGHDMTT